jgi:hypothetical protein
MHAAMDSDSNATAASPSEEGNFLATFFLYVAPFLIIFGSAGNLVSIGVLRSRSFRGTSHALLLTVLACVDTGVLLTGLLRHFIVSVAYIDIRTHSEAMCKVHIFLTYLFPQLSSWTLVLVTVERLIFLGLPLRAKAICTLHRVVIACIAMTSLLVAVNLHQLVIAQRMEEGGQLYCNHQTEHEQLVAWLDFALLSLIPLLIIIPSNCFIAHTLYESNRMRKLRLGSQRAAHQANSLTSFTVMLLVVTSFFVITTLPVAIFFIGRQTWDANHQVRIAYGACNMLYYLNSAVNFVLYCVSGSQFRLVLRQHFQALFCESGCCTVNGNSRTTSIQTS